MESKVVATQATKKNSPSKNLPFYLPNLEIDAFTLLDAEDTDLDLLSVGRSR